MEAYETDLMKGLETLWACPKILRPYLCHFIPRLRVLHRSVKSLENLIRPVVEEHSRSVSEDADSRAKDAVQWHLDRSDESERRDLEFQALCLINLITAGIGAMSIVVSTSNHRMTSEP